MSDIKELLIKADGLLKGHFCLTSGLHSDTYFQCAKLYQYPDIVEIIGKELAKKLYNNGNWITMEDYFGIDSKYND